MLFLIAILFLVFILYYYRLDQASSMSSEFVFYLCLSLIILCIVNAWRVLT